MDNEHCYDELAADDLTVREIVAGTPNCSIIEEYPEHPKGPCVLLFLRDREGYPVHAVWGIPFGSDSPAVLVTAYRPDPERWEDDFIRRKNEKKES